MAAPKPEPGQPEAGGVTRRRPSWVRALGWSALAVAAAAAAVVLVMGAGRTRRTPNQQVASMPMEPGTRTVGIAILDGALTIDSVGLIQQVAMGQQRAVSEHDVLRTSGSGGAQVRLGEVGKMTLAPSSRVVAVSAHPGAAGGSGDAVDRLTLVSGRAHLSIATLERGRTFRVLTDAATVRGHGTEFDVEVGTGPTPRTCVRVQDGLVEVTAGHEPHIERTEPTERTFVKHGESWGCDPPPATVHRGPAPPFP